MNAQALWQASSYEYVPGFVYTQDLQEAVALPCRAEACQWHAADMTSHETLLLLTNKFV